MSTPHTHDTIRPRFSQETIAIIATIVTVGIAIAGLVLATVNDLRDEARADRAAWQAESRHLRDEAAADRNRLRDEAAADRNHLRDEAREDREAWQAQILRLTETHAELIAASRQGQSP